MSERIDLSGLSPDDLVKLSARIGAEQVERRSRAIAELRERFTKEAESQGFTVEEVFGVQKRRSRAKPAAKYRHPEDATKTWSRRGKKPTWLVELIEADQELEHFRV